jgi:uncharacterized protein with PIN domain
VSSATFRFYGSLNDFLPRERRHTTLVCAFRARASVKDLVEAHGVPHPEVDALLVNGEPVDFSHLVDDGDRVAAYPLFEQVELGDEIRLTPARQTDPRFVADVHLGRLVGYLRLAGFDTAYRTSSADHDLVEISTGEDRTLLTRDVGVLKHRAVRRGYFVRNTQPGRQFVEVLRRFDLPPLAAPFTRCLPCNSTLRQVSKESVEARIPERSRAYYETFSECPVCGRIFWQGSHYERMREFLGIALAAASDVAQR